TATLQRDGRTEEVSCRFVAGCDGANSTVRRIAGIGWRGGSYREEVVLADAELDGLTPGRLHVVAGRRGLVFLFALGEGATWRILATRAGRSTDTPFGQPGHEVPLPEVRQLLADADLDVTVREL